VALQSLPFRRKKKTSRHSRVADPYLPVEKATGVPDAIPRRVVVPHPRSNSVKSGVNDLVPCLFSRFPRPSGLVCFRTSERWVPELHSKNKVRAVPFITREGAISSNAVCYWKCTSAQWFATVVATIYERLRKRLVRTRKFRGKGKMPHDLLTRIAAYYAITLEDSTFGRLMQCAKRNPSAARRYVWKLVSRMGENQRFLFDHALFSAKWFQLRTQKVCAKPIDYYRRSQLRKRVRVGSLLYPIRGIRTLLDDLSDPWIRRLPNKVITNLSTTSVKSYMSWKKPC